MAPFYAIILAPAGAAQNVAGLANPMLGVGRAEDTKTIPVIGNHPPRIAPVEYVRSFVARARDHRAGYGPMIEVGAIGGPGVRGMHFILEPHAPLSGGHTFQASVDDTIRGEF